MDYYIIQGYDVKKRTQDTSKEPEGEWWAHETAARNELAHRLQERLGLVQDAITRNDRARCADLVVKDRRKRGM